MYYRYAPRGREARGGVAALFIPLLFELSPLYSPLLPKPAWEGRRNKAPFRSRTEYRSGEEVPIALRYVKSTPPPRGAVAFARSLA
jgi:hypothetical protein